MKAFFTHHKRTLIIIGASLIVLAGVLMLTLDTPSASVPKITEKTARVDDLHVFIEADGTVIADKTTLNFSQTGILKDLHVTVGSQVRQGEELAALDSTKLLAQVNQAQANYSSSIEKALRLSPGGAEIIVKQKALDAARIALSAEQLVYNDVVAKYGVGSSQELSEAAKLRKAETDVVAAEAQFALTQATYADAQYSATALYANLEAARAAVNDMSIVAPMDGVVTSINGAVGQMVGGSQSSANGFITIARPDKLTIVSNLDEEDIVKLKIGQAVEADIAASGETVSATVAYISPIATKDQNGATSYEVRAIFEKGDRTILDGMSATIRIITKSVENVVVVPNKAVKLVNGKSTIQYYTNSRILQSKPVVTGFTDGTSVAITSGLTPGEKYVVIE